MATPDKVPAEQNRDRGGPQLTADEARAMAQREGTLPGAADAHGLRGPDGDREVPQVPQRDAAGAPGERGRGATNEQNTADMVHPEAALGGADSVQKTSFGVGTGTEPDGRSEFAPVGLRKGEGPVVSRTGPGGGINPVAWIVGLLALIVAAIYGFGILGG